MIKFWCLLVWWLFTCTNDILSSFGDLHVTICPHLTPPGKKGVLDLRRPKIWNLLSTVLHTVIYKYLQITVTTLLTLRTLFLLIGDFFGEIANILQLLLMLSEFAHWCAKMVFREFAHWCAKNDNFCWCANSHTGVRKKKPWS